MKKIISLTVLVALFISSCTPDPPQKIRILIPGESEPREMTCSWLDISSSKRQDVIFVDCDGNYYKVQYIEKID